MTPEVGTAVGHGAVTKKVAVADGVQIRDSAHVVSAGTTASSPLTVGAKRVPDASHMQRVRQLPLGPSRQDPICSSFSQH